MRKHKKSPPSRKTPKASPSKPRAAPIDQVLIGLRQEYPDVRCALEHQNPLELMIATILSAQCTDVRVNMVTPALFKKYPSALAFANASQNDIEEMIRSTGFFRNKAKSILGACQKIVNQYSGEVPKEMENLLTLPGVARKTANVVLGTAFGIASGVVVDTHVFRITHRLGLTRAKTPEKVELDLMELVPRDEWINFSHRLIHHGRRVCTARKPNCDGCVLEKLCPKVGTK